MTRASSATNTPSASSGTRSPSWYSIAGNPLQKAVILLCLVAALTACSRDRGPQLPYLPSDAVVLAFGDSLTHGTGAKADEAYPAVLAQLIGRRVVNVSTPGDQTTAGLEKLPVALAEHEPDLLLLCLGGNDFLRKRDAAETEANLARMIEIATEAGAQVMLLGVPQPGIFGLDGHPLYGELAERYGLLLDNETVAEVLSDRDLKSDAIHPNAAGYRQFAEAIAERLRKAGAI